MTDLADKSCVCVFVFYIKNSEPNVLKFNFFSFILIHKYLWILCFWWVAPQDILCLVFVLCRFSSFVVLLHDVLSNINLKSFCSVQDVLSSNGHLAMLSRDLIKCHCAYLSSISVFQYAASPLSSQVSIHEHLTPSMHLLIWYCW